MRMTDRQVEDLKKKFEPMGNVGACMDCDDHPDEKFDGRCSEAHRSEGYAGIIVGLADELLRYKALVKKRSLPEPRADEHETAFGSSDEAREEHLKGWLKKLTESLDSVREEHETTVSGEYDRCGCDICTASRRLEDPNIEIGKLTEEYKLVADEYERLAVDFDRGLVAGDAIRSDVMKSIGFFTKSPSEACLLIYKAIQSGLKDPAFAKLYEERRDDSRRRTLDRIRTAQATRRLNEEIQKLSEELAAAEKASKENPTLIAPSVTADLRARLTRITQELAGTKP